MTRTLAVRRSSIAVLLLSAGCVSWQPATAGPEAAILREQPERVRITRDDGIQAIIDEPRIEDDQIVGADACAGGRRCIADPWGNGPRRKRTASPFA